MSSMRFMSINLDGVPKRDTTDYASSFQLEWRAKDGLFAVVCAIGTDKYTLGKFPEPEARRVLHFCSQRPERARYAVRQLHLHGDEGPLEDFLENAGRYTENVRRSVDVTLKLHINMAGSDEDIKDYLHSKLQYAAHVVSTNILSIEDEI